MAYLKVNLFNGAQTADEATTTPPTSNRSQSERGQKNEAFAMLAPGISFGSQKLRILLEDDEPQA